MGFKTSPAAAAASNTEFSEDTAHSSGATGNLILGVRRDADTSPVNADNDYHTLIFNATGFLKSVLGANSGVDIGDVDVTSVIPGTGATNLGKAISSPVGGTDTGVLILGVHDAEASKIAVAEEDYDHLHIGELGGAYLSSQNNITISMSSMSLQVGQFLETTRIIYLLQTIT